MPADLTPRERAELIMKAPAWSREPNDATWAVLSCPRCESELLVNNDEFKSRTRGRVMLPCIYCGAYSRKPGMSLLKITNLFRSKA